MLASGSPRRAELLRALGLILEVRPSDVDETPFPGEAAERLVERLARGKAAAARPASDELVLAADTVVVIDGAVLGKPAGAADATRMLRLLAGRAHEVWSGVAWLDGATQTMVSAVEQTRVAFAPMSADEIAWYVASGEPLDKAGAYGIQARGSLFVTRVDGNYSNVVGLPLPLVLQLARALGHDLLTRLAG